MTQELSVLLFPEEGAWVAQCLDYDIAEQGATIDEAIENWSKAFQGHVMADIEEDREPLKGLKRAPAEFWNLWAKAKPLRDRTPLAVSTVKDSLPPAWMLSAIVNDLRSHRLWSDDCGVIPLADLKAELCSRFGCTFQHKNQNQNHGTLIRPLGEFKRVVDGSVHRAIVGDPTPSRLLAPSTVRNVCRRLQIDDSQVQCLQPQPGAQHNQSAPSSTSN